MPTYEYKCDACGVEFEATKKMSDPIETTCPKCGQLTDHRLISHSSFVLKGSGWYATDYGGKKSPGTSTNSSTGSSDGSSGGSSGGSSTGSSGGSSDGSSDGSSGSTDSSRAPSSAPTKGESPNSSPTNSTH